MLADKYSMILKKVEYTVKSGKVDEVKQAISEFVFNIKENEPTVMFYEVFQLTGTNSFIHFISFMDENAERSHQEAEHTKKFMNILNSSCAKKPIFTDLTIVATNKTRLE